MSTSVCWYCTVSSSPPDALRTESAETQLARDRRGLRQPARGGIEAGRARVRLRRHPDGPVIDGEQPSDHRVMQCATGTAPLAAGMHEQRPEASAPCIRDPEAYDNAGVVFKDPPLASLSKHLVISLRRRAARIS